jgi:hypothetical protein
VQVINGLSSAVTQRRQVVAILRQCAQARDKLVHAAPQHQLGCHSQRLVRDTAIPRARALLLLLLLVFF